MGATWKSVNHENLACAYKWDFDFGYEQVAKADCEYPIDYVVKLLVLTIGSINDRVILSEG